MDVCTQERSMEGWIISYYDPGRLMFPKERGVCSRVFKKQEQAIKFLGEINDPKRPIFLDILSLKEAKEMGIDLSQIEQQYGVLR